MLKIFPFTSMVIASSLSVIIAYKRVHRNTPLPDSAENLYDQYKKVLRRF